MDLRLHGAHFAVLTPLFDHGGFGVLRVQKLLFPFERLAIHVDQLVAHVHFVLFDLRDFVLQFETLELRVLQTTLLPQEKRNNPKNTLSL
jgi:hypothetical protein